MIVDVHNHIGEITGARQTVEQLLTHMDEAGVDKCVVFAWPQWPDNDYVVEAAAKYPKRILPFACVNPWSPDAVSKLERLFEERRVVGLKLHPLLQGYALDNLELIGPLMELCEKHRAPVLIHGMADNPFTMPLQFQEVAGGYPGVTLIMAHSGFLWGVGQALRVAKRCSNLFLETSVTDATDVRAMVETLGPERVIMGTDTPFGFHDMEMAKIARAVEDPEARRLIMGENILGLLRIPNE
jgi:predicted TIM-barrel fold metal-dependent hydrolase